MYQEAEEKKAATKAAKIAKAKVAKAQEKLKAVKETAMAAAKVGTDADKKQAENGIREAEAELSVAKDELTSAELVLKRETAEAAAAAAAVEAAQETDLARASSVSRTTKTGDFDEATAAVGATQHALVPSSKPAATAAAAAQAAAAVQAAAAEAAAHEAKVAEKKKAEVCGHPCTTILVYTDCIPSASACHHLPNPVQVYLLLNFSPTIIPRHSRTWTASR